MLKNIENILLLDDDSLIVSTLKNIMTFLNYNLSSVSTGEEALELLKNNEDSSQKFDVIIMDLAIPNGLGGKDIIKDVKKLYPEIKTIVSTGNHADPVVTNYKDFGFDAVLTKPFTIDLLKSILNSL